MSPLLGFTKLLPALLDGTKTQTIRVPRKRPIEADEWLYVYWKLRTKDCYFIGLARTLSVQRIMFAEITDEIARRDGFVDRTACIRGLLLLHPTLIGSDELDVIRFEWVQGPYAKEAAT